MNVTLTPEQHDALSRGEDVCVTIDDTECVLVRKDVYQKARHLYDDSDWTDDELRVVAARTILDADTAGPIE